MVVKLFEATYKNPLNMAFCRFICVLICCILLKVTYKNEEKIDFVGQIEVMSR